MQAAREGAYVLWRNEQLGIQGLSFITEDFGIESSSRIRHHTDSLIITCRACMSHLCVGREAELAKEDLVQKL